MITINDDSMGRQLVHPKDDIELRYVDDPQVHNE